MAANRQDGGALPTNGRSHLRLIDCTRPAQKAVNPRTMELLRTLLSVAAAGQLPGLMCCYQDDEGYWDVILSGVYLDDPGQATAHALKIANFLAEKA